MNTQIVVVTGAAGALGQTVAEYFLAQGASLIAVDVQADLLLQVYGKRERVHCVASDLTKVEQESLTQAIRQSGGVTILCNIAGGFDMGPSVHETADAMWRRLADLNVATLINASRVVVPAMLDAGYGKIINVAAASAVSGKGAMGAYCASKSAVARLTESMSFELRERGVNVNAVAPSIIDTPANRKSMPDAEYRNWVSTADLAAVIGFLASPAASAIHGAVIPVVGLS